MHVVELTRLHKDIQSVSIISPEAPKLDASELDYRRRLAWLAKITYHLVSSDLGGVEITLEYAFPENSEDSDFPTELLQLVKLLPSDNLNPADGTRLTQLKQAMDRAIVLTTKHDVHHMIKADLVLCMFRRLGLGRSSLMPSNLKTVSAAG